MIFQLSLYPDRIFFGMDLVEIGLKEVNEKSLKR